MPPAPHPELTQSKLESSGLAVEVRDIGKRYHGARALENVSISIAAGEVHSLVGENGAGKSTLGKIIAGAVLPDSGEIRIDGRAVRHRTPRDGIRAGIAMVDQELAMVPALSVLDNVFLGMEHVRRGALMDRGAQRAEYTELARRLDFRVDPATEVGALSTADQQIVEILRALARKARLIVMDEPTSALSRPEVERLLAVVRDLRASGVTIVFVSHILEDVIALSDTVSVLKDGYHVKTSPVREETVESLVTAMLGRSLDLIFPERPPVSTAAPILLSVRNLSNEGRFRDVSFDVRAGEIVGLAGLVGSGRTEIVRAIFGADRSSGEITMDGRPLRAHSPRTAINRGLALLPESRKDQGLAMALSIADNVTMVHLEEMCSGAMVRRRDERKRVDEVLDRLRVTGGNRKLPVSSLSGGNQQKVALAKWLVKPPRLLIADEPTRGVDIGAKRAIYQIIRDLAASGVGILLISSELEEVMGLAHRVLVVRAGRVVRELAGEAIDEESVMRAAFGHKAVAEGPVGGGRDVS